MKSSIITKCITLSVTSVLSATTLTLDSDLQVNGSVTADNLLTLEALTPNGLIEDDYHVPIEKEVFLKPNERIISGYASSSGLGKVTSFSRHGFEAASKTQSIGVFNFDHEESYRMKATERSLSFQHNYAYLNDEGEPTNKSLVSSQFNSSGISITERESLYASPRSGASLNNHLLSLNIADSTGRHAGGITGFNKGRLIVDNENWLKENPDHPLEISHYSNENAALVINGEASFNGKVEVKNVEVEETLIIKKPSSAISMGRFAPPTDQ